MLQIAARIVWWWPRLRWHASRKCGRVYHDVPHGTRPMSVSTLITCHRLVTIVSGKTFLLWKYWVCFEALMGWPFWMSNIYIHHWVKCWLLCEFVVKWDGKHSLKLSMDSYNLGQNASYLFITRQWIYHFLSCHPTGLCMNEDELNILLYNRIQTNISTSKKQRLIHSFICTYTACTHYKYARHVLMAYSFTSHSNDLIIASFSSTQHTCVFSWIYIGIYMSGY